MQKVILVNDTKQRLGVTPINGKTIFVDPKSKSELVEIDDATLVSLKSTSDLKVKGESEAQVQSGGDNSKLVADLEKEVARLNGVISDSRKLLDEQTEKSLKLQGELEVSESKNAELKKRADDAELALLEKDDAEKAKGAGKGK